MAELVYRLLGANVRRPPAAGENYKRGPADVDKMLRPLLHDNGVQAVLALEVARYHAMLRGLATVEGTDGYDALIFDDPGHGDNAILVRKDIEHGPGYDIEHGGLAWWLTTRGSKSWGRAHVTVKLPGLRIVAVHTPPSVSWVNRLPVGPALRIRVYRAMMTSLRAQIEQWERDEPDDGLLVFGDWNEPHSARGEDSPNDVAADHGLEIFPGANIDWSMGRNVRVSTRVIPVGREGNTSDHPLVLMDVTVQAPAAGPAPAPTPQPTPDPVPTPTQPQEAPVMAQPYLIEHPPARRQFKARGTTFSGVVVIHTAESAPDVTGMDLGAEGVAKFIRGRSDPGCYHYLADSDSLIQMVPLDQQTYGDGTGSNPHAVHISAATQAAKWPGLPKVWTEKTVKNMALAAHKASDYCFQLHGVRIPARRVTKAQSSARQEGFISHGERDPGRRTDPGPAFPWKQFFAEYERLEGTAKSTRPAPPAPNRMQQIKALLKSIIDDPKTTTARRTLCRAVDKMLPAA